MDARHIRSAPPSRPPHTRTPQLRTPARPRDSNGRLASALGGERGGTSAAEAMPPARLPEHLGDARKRVVPDTDYTCLSTKLPCNIQSYRRHREFRSTMTATAATLANTETHLNAITNKNDNCKTSKTVANPSTTKSTTETFWSLAPRRQQLQQHQQQQQQQQQGNNGNSSRDNTNNSNINNSNQHSHNNNENTNNDNQKKNNNEEETNKQTSHNSKDNDCDNQNCLRRQGPKQVHNLGRLSLSPANPAGSHNSRLFP